jgi:hypothetical protein
LHFYLTSAKGATSRSHNAPKRAKGKAKKIASYKLTWTNCKYGHDTFPGKECAKCNAIAQANFKVKARVLREEHDAALRAARAAEIAAERDRDLFDELIVGSA